MNIQETHVWAETFLGILPRETSPALIATLASLNSEWRAAVAGELRARLYRKLHHFVSFVGEDGAVHLSTPLGVEAVEPVNISETHLDVPNLLRALTALSAWSVSEGAPPFPSVHDVFKPEMDDTVLTSNTALFLLANVWTYLKLPVCCGTSCDAEDFIYNMVDVALLAQRDETPKENAVQIFWMFLFLRFVMLSRWSPEAAAQLDAVKLVMVVIEVSYYLRYKIREAALPLPPGLREQVNAFLLADLVELEDQGMGAESALRQADDADRV